MILLYSYEGLMGVVGRLHTSGRQSPVAGRRGGQWPVGEQSLAGKVRKAERDIEQTELRQNQGLARLGNSPLGSLAARSRVLRKYLNRDLRNRSKPRKSKHSDFRRKRE